MFVAGAARFLHALVAANCALSKPHKRALQLRFVAAPLSRKSHGFARVLGRKLRFGRNDKRGETADNKSGKMQPVDSPALSFRAQSRNLTALPGRPRRRKRQASRVVTRLAAKGALRRRGAPEWIRTIGTRRRRSVLYPTELQVHVSGGNAARFFVFLKVCAL